MGKWKGWKRKPKKRKEQQYLDTLAFYNLRYTPLDENEMMK